MWGCYNSGNYSMARQNIIKQSTHRYLEINDPEKAVGLWSHFQQRTTTLIPDQDTKRALGRFLNEDIARHDCWDEMKKALLAKNVEGEKRKTEARKLAEYEEEFRQEGKLPPKWLVLWRRFGSRLKYQYEFSDRPEDVQMFFGHPSVGIGCQEPHHHSSRVLFLRKKVPTPSSSPTTNHYRRAEEEARMGES